MTTSDKPDPAADSKDAPVEHTGVAAQDWATASADPQYRAAVVDLLGALAYGELAAFERLAEDAKLAPTWLYGSCTCSPSIWTAAKQASAMNDTSSAYSTSEAPRSGRIAVLSHALQ